MAQITLPDSLDDEGVFGSVAAGPRAGRRQLAEDRRDSSGYRFLPHGQRRTFLANPVGEAVQGSYGVHPITRRGSVAASASAVAIRVRSIAISSWASETNQASNCEGGNQMPRSSIPR